MNRRAALGCLLVTASGCGRSSPAAELPGAVRSLITAGRDFGESSPADEAFAAADLLRIAEQVRRDANGLHASIALALNQTVYGALGFSREIVNRELRFVLLPGVLRSRRGSCVGLGSLYLALTELLRVPCSGVLLPGHFFVRILEQGRQRNVELLRRGEEMPESWYQERYPVQGAPAPAYGRSLSTTEVQGVIEFDIGNERRRQGRLHEARRAYQRATQHFPQFAEAHASLGSVLHLLGALDAAALAYRAADRENPGLPGLAANIDLLEREQGKREAAGDSNQQKD